MQAAESGPLTLFHRPNAGPRATAQHVQFDDASLPKNDNQMVEADDFLARPVKPAELAQAQVFEMMLQAEFARLSELANRMAGPRDWLKSSGIGTSESHYEPGEIYARIDEVRQLLSALRDRFLRSPVGY
jgi:hypothetical protein